MFLKKKDIWLNVVEIPHMTKWNGNNMEILLILVCTIQINWQHLVHETQEEDIQSKKHNTICVGHYYAQTNTNNIN